MTLEETKNLCVGENVYDIYNNKWKILSIRRWKRTPERILISLKFGIYGFAKVNEKELHLIKLNKEN